MDERPDEPINGNGKKPTLYHPYRCLHCGRLLFEAILLAGCRVRVRCPKCGHILVVGPLVVEMEAEEILTN